MSKKRIIDQRKKEKFMMDDAYLNGQARLCGWQATLAYSSLCRHANKSQECFPSIKLMAEELAVNRKTILKGLYNLEKYNVIKVKKQRTKDGRWLNNTYILLDKSEWIKNQVPERDTVSKSTTLTPSMSLRGNSLVPERDTVHVPERDTKETHNTRKHIKGNSSYEELEEKPQSYGNPLINEIISYLKSKAGWIDGSQRAQRYQSNIFIKRVNKLIREMGGEVNENNTLDGCKRIIDLAAQDKFHYKNMGKIKYLSDNIGSIIRSSKNNTVVNI